MIKRKTVLDQVEHNFQGETLGVRVAFLLVEGDKEIDRKLHRASIPAGTDPLSQMDELNAHLSAMDPPMPLVSEVDIDFVVQCHALLKQRVATQ